MKSHAALVHCQVLSICCMHFSTKKDDCIKGNEMGGADDDAAVKIGDNQRV